MTDQPDAFHQLFVRRERELTPDQPDAVVALLAGAIHEWHESVSDDRCNHIGGKDCAARAGFLLRTTSGQRLAALTRDHARETALREALVRLHGAASTVGSTSGRNIADFGWHQGCTPDECYVLAALAEPAP